MSKLIAKKLLIIDFILVTNHPANQPLQYINSKFYSIISFKTVISSAC